MRRERGIESGGGSKNEGEKETDSTREISRDFKRKRHLLSLVCHKAITMWHPVRIEFTAHS